MSIIDVDYYNKNRGIYSELIEHNGCICGYWLVGNDYRNKSSYYGTYPPNYLKRVRLLFPRYEEHRVLHVFSGVVEKEKNEMKLDINPALNPEILGNAEEMPIKSNRFDIILADPPYEKSDSERYGCKHPNKKKVIKECARVLNKDGVLVWLDTRIPMWAKADGWKLRGTIGFNQSTQHRTRTITILEKSNEPTR